MDTIGGFRLVRRLGSGARAEVHLGHSVVAGDGVERTAAVKVFRPSTPIASIEGEIEALARVSSRFLLRLDDLAMSAEGVPVLILERVGATALSTLCLERSRIGPGEAVTIIAPLADAISELHRVGVAHRNVRLSTVHFDDSGAPKLLGFGRANIIGPLPAAPDQHSLTAAAIESTPAVRTDLDDLRSVARNVVECVSDSAARSSLFEWLAAGIGDPSTFCEELSRRMFDLAEPTPVELHRRRSADQTPRSIPLSRIEPDEPTTTPLWLGVLHLPAWLNDLVPTARGKRPAFSTASRGTGRRSEQSSPGTGLVDRARAILAPVRRPVWVAAGVVAALLVAAISVVGVGGDSPADASGESADRATLDTGSSPSPTGAGADETALSAAPGDEADDAVLGEDAVAAVTALLMRRSSCFEQASILCLDEVDQSASAAMEADIFAINSIDPSQSDAESTRSQTLGDSPDLTSATPVLVEHFGGSALLRLEFGDNPTTESPVKASVLVVKGESGWRIRDLVVG